MNGEQPDPQSSEAGQFSSAREYEQLQPAVDTSRIPRTARELEVYKKAFGEDLGKGEELILDVGAGDSSFADEIKDLPDHHATVVRLDADYARMPPPGETPAVAADAMQMPFADNSFDRVVSFWMLPHLGPDIGTKVMSEVLRVLRPDGRALLFPARPFKQVQNDMAQRRRNQLMYPSLVVTKPRDFTVWEDSRKDEIYRELAGYVTYGGPIFKLIKSTHAVPIKLLGTAYPMKHNSFWNKKQGTDL